MPMIRGFIDRRRLRSCAAKSCRNVAAKRSGDTVTIWYSGGEPPLASSHATFVSAVVRRVRRLRRLRALGCQRARLPAKLRPRRPGGRRDDRHPRVRPRLGLLRQRARHAARPHPRRHDHRLAPPRLGDATRSWSTPATSSRAIPLTYVAARVDTTMRHPVIAAMNAMQYDAAAIGNHEFNYGAPDARPRGPRSASFRSSPRTSTPRRHAALPHLGACRRAAASRSPSSARRRPASMVWDRDNLAAAGSIDPRHRSRGACRRSRSARRGRRRRDRRRCTPGSNEPSSYDTVGTGVAERERRGAGRARSAGHRPHRLRPLAPGDGGHASSPARCSCSRRTGRRALRSRISRRAARRPLAGRGEAELRSSRRRITRRTRRCSR